MDGKRDRSVRDRWRRPAPPRGEAGEKGGGRRERALRGSLVSGDDLDPCKETGNRIGCTVIILHANDLGSF